METRKDIEKEHGRYKTILSKDFNLFKGDKFKKASRILLVAGGIVIGYFIIRKLFFTSRKEKKVNTPVKQTNESSGIALESSENLPFTEILKNGIAAILLGIAKQKIEGLLERGGKERG